MSDKDKYYIDGYGTKRPKDVPFWDSAKGQLVKKAGNDLLTTGSFALGLLLPFGEIPETEKYVGSYDTAVSSVNPKDLKRTVVEHYKLPAKKVRVLEHDVYPDGQVDLVASISNDILPTSYSFINRAHPYKLSEDVLKNIPMYNWESVANRIRNSFGISGGLGATGTYIYLRNEKGSR